MIAISDERFEAMISRAIDEMPRRYIDNLQNVAITYDDEPNEHQSQKLKLRGDSLLLGLYEGIPLPQRGSGYNLVLPDKITIFKKPIMVLTHDRDSLYRQVKHTLWHEIAHYYGLGHDAIHRIEKEWRD